jgi:hypothetical protein
MERMSSSCLCFFWVGLAASTAQAPEPAAPVQPQVLARAVADGRVAVVYLAPRYATAIRMHEAINSVVVGDPSSFSECPHEMLLVREAGTISTWMRC